MSYNKREKSPQDGWFESTGPPIPREKGSMFDHVPDAYEGKSLNVGRRVASNRTVQNENDKTVVEEVFIAEKITDIPEATPFNRNKSAQNRLLIRNGRVVNADQILQADVYVEDGVIKQVGTNLMTPGGVKTIEAKGKFIIPGGIDPHTIFSGNLGVESADDFYSGTKAALAGGTTMIINEVLARKGENINLSYDRVREKADGKVCCDYSLEVLVPSWDDSVAKDMETLAKDKGVNAFVLSMGYKDVTMLEDDEIYSAIKKCKELGALPIVFAENGKLVEKRSQEIFDMGIRGPEGHLLSRDEDVETDANIRAMVIAQQAGAPLYLNNKVSQSVVRAIADKRREGNIVFAEVLAAGIGSDGGHYFNKCWRHAAGHLSSPPLRPDPKTSDALLDFLANNGLQTTASQHFTFNANQKAHGKDDFRKIPHGINGVEDRMSVIWEKGVVSGKLDPCQFVAVTSTNAAKLFNLYPQKGHIAVGSDADIVIWDPESTRTISAKTHYQAVDFNIFESMTCHGVPEVVICNGSVVLEDGHLKVTQGYGRFIPRECWSQAVYGRIKNRDIANRLVAVEREEFEGSIEEKIINPSHSAPVQNASPITPDSATSIHHRPPTRGGGRNMHESSWAFSGEQIDDVKGHRPHVKHINPPGGVSTQPW